MPVSPSPPCQTCKGCGQEFLRGKKERSPFHASFNGGSQGAKEEEYESVPGAPKGACREGQVVQFCWGLQSSSQPSRTKSGMKAPGAKRPKDRKSERPATHVNGLLDRMPGRSERKAPAQSARSRL